MIKNEINFIKLLNIWQRSQNKTLIIIRGLTKKTSNKLCITNQEISTDNTLITNSQLHTSFRLISSIQSSDKTKFK